MALSRRSRRRTGTMRKNPSYYLMPLGISVGIVIMVTLLFNLYVHMQHQQEQALKSEPLAQISIESDNVAVIFNNERTKVDKGYRVDWNNGEGLETGENSRLFIPLATKDQARLDSNSTVFGKRDEGRSIVLAFDRGDMWLRSENAKPANEASIVRMDRLRVPLTSKATLAITDSSNQEIVAVVAGSVFVQVTSIQGNVIKTVDVGVGQQLRITSQNNSNSFEDELEAIPTESSASEWFQWNQQQDAAIDAYEGSGAQETVTAVNGNANAVTFGNINATATFRNKNIGLQGGYDPEEVASLSINDKVATLDENTKTWKLSLSLPNEGKNTLRTVYTKPDGTEVEHSTREVTVDEAGPESPKLSSPQATTVTSAHVVLQGTVGAEAKRVRVNDYELKKFVPGEAGWTYHLNAGDNMSPGTNTYTVTAYDEVGNQSDPLVVTLTYEPSATPAPASTSNTNSATATPVKTNQNKNTNTAPAAAQPKPAATQPAATLTPKPAPATTEGGSLTPTNVRSGSGSGL